MSSRPLSRFLLRPAIGLLLLLTSLEVGVRLLSGPLAGMSPGDLSALRAHALGGGRPPFSPVAFRGYAYDPALPGINRLGFRDLDRGEARHPGVARVLCLGGNRLNSDSRSAPPLGLAFELERALKAGLDAPVEVLDWTVRGWTSAEALIAWQLLGRELSPDVVVLQLGWEDVAPRLAPDFQSDYRHWRQPWRAPVRSTVDDLLLRVSDLWLLLRRPALEEDSINDVVNVPAVAASLLAPADTFARNLHNLVEEVHHAGSLPLLMTTPLAPDAALTPDARAALDEHSALIRAAALEWGVPLLDLAALVKQLPDPEQLFTEGVTTNLPGERVKAHLLANMLVDSGALAAPK